MVERFKIHFIENNKLRPEVSNSGALASLVISFAKLTQVKIVGTNSFSASFRIIPESSSVFKLFAWLFVVFVDAT